MPAFGTNLAGQRAVHEERVAVVAPRTTKVELGDIVGNGDGTLVEDVAELGILGCGGSGDVAVCLAVDGTLLEPGGRRAKDEVGGAFDVAVVEQQASVGHACVDGVLVSTESAVDEAQTVALGMERHGLSQSG